MLSEGFIEHLMGDEEYVSVREVAGDDALKLFAMQAASQNPQVDYDEELIESLLEVAERVYIKFPEIGEDPQPDQSLTEIEPEKVGEAIQGEWPNIREELIRSTAERIEEEFPIIVDMFRAGGVTFAYKLEQKEENLSAAMDFFVEQEEYETAAEIRDELEQMGSEKVKTQQ